MEYSDFIDYIASMGEDFFIEVEAKPDKMEKFIQWYNAMYTPHISTTTDGVCVLGENVDKWGTELRIYLNDVADMPPYWKSRMHGTRNYRSEEFGYRVDDHHLVEELFRQGYRIGYN
jgi:hypothetical protein